MVRVLILMCCLAVASGESFLPPAVGGGIVALPSADQAMVQSLLTDSQWVIHAQYQNWEDVQRARIWAAEHNCLERLAANIGDGVTIPLADRSVDWILLAPSAKTPQIEIERVLAVGGTARWYKGVEQIQEWQRPALAGTDSWSHWWHGPDNNPLSTDTALVRPLRTQYIALPYHGSEPNMLVAAGGRTFMVTGHKSVVHDTWRQVLIARNGNNGCEIWRRKLPKNFLSFRPVLVATEKDVYLLEEKTLYVLDGASGKEKQTWALPSFGKWLAVVGQNVYVLCGDEDPSIIDRGHYPGDGAYKKNIDIPWGLGHTVIALRATDGTECWRHNSAELLDARCTAISDDRLFIYSRDAYVRCLNTSTGAVLWQQKSKGFLAAISEKRPKTGKIGFGGGLMSTNASLFVSNKTVCLYIKMHKNAVGLSVDDGSLLWTASKKGRQQMHILGLENGISMKGSEKKYVERKGQKSATPVIGKGGGCGRVTATPHYIIDQAGLISDRDTNTGLRHFGLKSACRSGMIPADGRLLSIPYKCTCSIALTGFISLGLAGSESPAAGALTKKQATIKSSDASWLHARGNEQRTGASRYALTAQGKQAWVVPSSSESLPPIISAHIIISSDTSGLVRGINGADGSVLWSWVAGGGLRSAPTLAGKAVYIGAGDGTVSCLESSDGSLCWQQSVAPVRRGIMAYGVLSDTWPVHGGLCIHDNVCYAAAGRADWDGTWLAAIDAVTGAMIWQNDEAGRLIDDKNQRGATAAGSMVFADKQLWLVGGQALNPVIIDPQTGASKTARLGADRKHMRGREIGLFDNRFLVFSGSWLYRDPSRKSFYKGEACSFVVLKNGKPQYPEIIPFQKSFQDPAVIVPPVWDDVDIIFAKRKIGKTGKRTLVCWPADKTSQWLDAALKQAGKPNKNDPRFSMARMKNAPAEPTRWESDSGDVTALILSKNTVISAESTGNKHVVVARSRETGMEQWSCSLSSSATALALNKIGEVIVSLQSGGIVCVR